MQAVWTQIRTYQKKLILKKASRRQEKHEKLPSMQRVKEGVDACALSAIRRRAVLKALARLQSWSGSHVPSLVTLAIRT